MISGTEKKRNLDLMFEVVELWPENGILPLSRPRAPVNARQIKIFECLVIFSPCLLLPSLDPLAQHAKMLNFQTCGVWYCKLCFESSKSP